ncbi:VOC family protein [Acidisphaera sp. S103]|uniref:VOC family protein n=1 Tax=Acidisphaera sp. S103 TaxID=1747223 RepID=UPI00131BC67C|nr:VOC family protein [Acidisphaera sp. S103]
MLTTPGFHHLHLNSVDPDAAIDFYVRQFPTSSKGTWAGLPALLAPNNCMILFNKVDTPPVSEPQSAIWHFGWHVPDARATLETFKTRPEVKLQPLYTTDEGGSVLISSDTWPNIGNTLGLTKSQIQDARRSGAKPPGGGGFIYLKGGPDNALIEFAGNHGAERFNHVHMWQEHPFCALLWYQKHLNAPVRPGFAETNLTETTCQVPRGADKTWPALKQQGMYRTPRAGVEFGDVVLTWYANQGDAPLVSPRGQLQDHIALSVANLDAWTTKLRDEGVTFLEEPYTLGDTRAVMIEGPSREALELVEVA